MIGMLGLFGRCVCVFPLIVGVIGWHFPFEVTDFRLAWIRHIMYPDV